MAAAYSKYSPYAKTDQFGSYLDIANIPSILPDKDDVILTINKTYQYRPDLLAYDLYGDANLWWVFTIRNPNVIKDPIYDMIPGTVIYIPKQNKLVQLLG